MLVRVQFRAFSHLMSYVKLHDLLTIEIKWRGPMVVHSKKKWRLLAWHQFKKEEKQTVSILIESV